jgi:zinc transporter 9
MSHTSGNKSVTFALIGNVFVTITKGIVAVFSGSTSMFAESVHSFADTLNQSLLLIGLNRSKKPADDIRGYGYGIERFFWSLISACGILFVGAGVTIYHSIHSLINNGGSSNFHLYNIVVLLIALVIESITLYIAIKELKGNKKFSRKMLDEADPVVLAVVYEDGVAVIGVVVALIAQFLTVITNNNLYDSVGGIVVGIILGVLAVILIRKNHHYLIGKSIKEEVKEEIIELLLKDPCIEKILEFKSVAVNIGKYRIYVSVEWNGTPLYHEIYDAGELKEEFESVKDDFQEFTKLMLKTTDRVPRVLGTHIDDIEKKITSQFPEVLYVDIEIN